MITPLFEELARSKTRSGVAFAKVDMDVGMGSSIGGEWSVRVTPTFLFFLDGKKVSMLGFSLSLEAKFYLLQVHELKGVNAPELRTQVDLLLYEAFPREY